MPLRHKDSKYILFLRVLAPCMLKVGGAGGSLDAPKKFFGLNQKNL
jgi:hypothetical protein